MIIFAADEVQVNISPRLFLEIGQFAAASSLEQIFFRKYYTNLNECLL